MRMRSVGQFGFGIVLSIAIASSSFAETCSQDAVELRGDWGTARFTVELADDAIERQRGLMHRADMPVSAGMLFVYHQTREVSFWMKNTLIPLDMLFFDEAGTAVKVHSRAIPGDLRSISSETPARYVLEINGGLAEALGIGVGTQIRHPSVLQHKAVWPCREK